MKIELSALSTDRLRDPLRRKFIAGSGALGLTGFLSGGLTLSGSALAQEKPAGSPLLGFQGIAASTPMRLWWPPAIAQTC